MYVRLAAVYEAIEALEDGDVGKALSMLRTMAAVDDRKELRRVRDEVFKRYRHAQLVGDDNEALRLRELLAQCDDARSSLTA